MDRREVLPLLPLLLLLLLLIAASHVEASTATTSGTSLAPPSSAAVLRYPRYCHWDSPSEGSLYCRQKEPASSGRLNLTELPAESLISLTLLCYEPVDDEYGGDDGEPLLPDRRAPLAAEELGHLWRLRALRIIGCRVGRLAARAFAGLRDLRNLTIRTDSAGLHHVSPQDGTAAGGRFALEIEEGAFDAAAQLEKIDLSANNVWQVPRRAFCPLANLVSLNLSRNLLEDLAELEFGSPAGPAAERRPRRLQEQPPASGQQASGCSLDIRVLDLSRNRISVIGGRLLSALRRLSTLNLAGNGIAVLEDEALQGLRSLRSLDLSDNRIVALPTGLFREAANSLKELKLQNNSLTVLAPSLVANMNQLVALDLSRNLLTSSWMSGATFSGLIRLVLLDLSFNRIDKLDPALFKDLYTLQILNLKSNEIERIAPDTFAPMSNLHTLELSHNQLQYLEGSSLNGLYALSLLALNYNLIESIHPDAFKNCSSIQDLQLSGNNLEAVPAALRDMGILKMLDLGENRLRVLERSSFEGLSSLYGLRLMNNYVENLTQDALAELPALQILNLARNRIERLEPEAFRANPMLQAVRLDCNLLGELSGAFANVSSLLWLNVSDNRIERFDYRQLPGQLQWLDLHQNEIAELGAAPAASRLQTLDASFNRLSRIAGRDLPDSLELLFLNDNLVESVEPQSFVGKLNLSRVDLYANQIVRMELSALQLSQLPAERPLPEFYIGGNPFVCDCTTEWLQRINNLQLRQHPRVMDLQSVYCRLPYDRRRSFVPLLEAKPSQFLCGYSAHCFALCHCCDFDACDCEMTCPGNCTCYHDQSWAANVVDCSSSGYKRLPGRLPMDATEVYLDGNELGELNSHSFIGRKNLEILYANDSQIVSIRNFTFSGLRRLSVLHLENNRIAALHGMELAPLEALKELYLQNNLLAHIENGTFLPLRQLEILRLDNNRLTRFAVWLLARNPYLVELGLAGNPWHCECGYLGRLRDWMLANREKLADWRRVGCAGGGLPVLVNGSQAAADCAALASVSSSARDRRLEAYLPLLLASGVLLCVTLALLCGGLRHRRALRAWAASRCGLRACYKTAAFEDREKPFDAYISYSAVDEAFVSRVLVPGLEASYRLCLHYRDLGAGSSVAEAVAEAADSSRRTILVLSRNFLHGEWARFEFKAALREALRGRGRNVILLLVGGVCPRDLDAELRRRLSSHTLLVWGDKLFWQKLRFAMPELNPQQHLERPPSLPTPPPPPQHLWA
ncbi:toll-like receptor 6 [Nasonia vitripennis]|uniref:TIR domain-containing protein n=1 Tax=Nasonia vitripennis TaxID=7425 RepID=A0A7M7J0E1_NASVI|nr:toll-like receptor 6 [Nasonia vitripennis]